MRRERAKVDPMIFVDFLTGHGEFGLPKSL